MGVPHLVPRNASLDVKGLVTMAVKRIVGEDVMVVVKDFVLEHVLEHVEAHHINLNCMKALFFKLLIIMLYVMLSIHVWGQEDYPLETRYRNPVDTTSFWDSPTMLIFVHSRCEENHLCATSRMQKTLESDSLKFRSKFGIKLYVIYPHYTQADIHTFDSFSPTNDAIVAFYTESKHKGTFHENGTTPHIIFYDGKGHVRTKTGGTIEELNDSICDKWRYTFIKSPVCHGTGRVKPKRNSGDPDFSVGICRRFIGKYQLY